MSVSDKARIKAIIKEIEYLKKLDELDKFYSDKKLGSFFENGKTYFRLFAPNAEKVSLAVFVKAEDTEGSLHDMNRDENGVWETSLAGEQYGLFYGFKVKQHGRNPYVFCLDPYAGAVASCNTYFNPRKAIVVKENDFDWGDDTWISRDWRDLVIYEMHIRDMTIHPTSGAGEPGTYLGLVEENKRGGINYIKKLGVNAVELLPSQEFGNTEIPYRKTFRGRHNTWNPYEINHWGYMTAAFFAPESYYSENVPGIERDKWYGKTSKPVSDFKQMVKAFHKEGISVIMDVVYNHLSEYELGNLKEIDTEYYFRLDGKGNLTAQSGTGNDLRTERPMLRRLILESVLYWVKEYHIDGFRFDLGKLIDWETLELVKREVLKINPHAVFISEPWGGGYDPAGFSVRGYASWNDQVRNGIKGENPFNGTGWIFGHWYGNNNHFRIMSYINGTLIKDQHGLFQKPEHSVNYLESHDGYTLGDFIRLALKETGPHQVIKDVDKHIKLSPLQLKLNKLAALFLFSCRGIVMLHEGQEFARSKVIPFDKDNPDTAAGTLDHNSYNKDDGTNYINYDHTEINKELLEYYKGLITLRNTYDAIRRAEYNDAVFFNTNDFTLGFHLKYKVEEFIFLFNADPYKDQEFFLPEGEWDILVNETNAGIKILGKAINKTVLKPTSGMVLKKLK